MSHTPHDLAEMMPDQAEAIHRRKAEDTHFARVAARYDEINRAIHRAESDLEPTDDFHMQEMRKQRLALLDEIRGLLAA